ncbi:hypothetical protein ACEQ38_14060 [Ralstonia syzygii subsp. celebesensis]|nr:hypothetical protein [Ralstonia syzygii]
MSTPTPKRVWIRIWQLLIILTAVCAFVPLRPEMPQAGLDHSWVLGMNQAVAQGLVFGRDIIFTFGPYASIYTKSFHPATDHLMVVGALFLGLIYGTGLVLVARGREAIPLAGLCLALALAAGLPQSQDSLLLAYPLIVSLYCFGLPRQASPSQGAWSLLAISVSVLFLPFGLLPLIKGSLVALCLAVTLFAVIRFVTISRWDLAIAAPLSQALALITFWLASGQPLSGLPGYFQSMTRIIPKRWLIRARLRRSSSISSQQLRWWFRYCVIAPEARSKTYSHCHSLCLLISSLFSRPLSCAMMGTP